MNNTIPTRAPSVCIPFISALHSLFLMFPNLRWKKLWSQQRRSWERFGSWMCRKGAEVVPHIRLKPVTFFSLPSTPVSSGVSVLSLWFTHHHMWQGADIALVFFFYFPLQPPEVQRQNCNQLAHSLPENTRVEPAVQHLVWRLSETIHLIKFAGYCRAGRTNVVWENSSSVITVECLFNLTTDVCSHFSFGKYSKFESSLDPNQERPFLSYPIRFYETAVFGFLNVLFELR